jgi:hypothetical protein
MIKKIYLPLTYRGNMEKFKRDFDIIRKISKPATSRLPNPARLVPMVHLALLQLPPLPIVPPHAAPHQC